VEFPKRGKQPARNHVYRIYRRIADGKSNVGGVDTVSAVKRFGHSDKMTFISTGGGASLELIEGRDLPGLAALPDK